MSTTYTPTQTASFIAGLVDTTSLSLPLSNVTGACGLYRFQMPSSNIYFNYPLTISLPFGGTFVGPTETFNVLMLLDASALTTLTNGVIDVSLIPPPAWLFGTADYLEIGTVTLSAYATTDITLDLAMVTRIMSASQSYNDTWTGSLLFWVVAEQDSSLGGLSLGASLTAYGTIDYTNRDTGSRGDINQTSRWDRCPVSGLKVPRGNMVMDGYRNILVAPDSYDEPEPDPLDWADMPDENEGK